MYYCQFQPNIATMNMFKLPLGFSKHFSNVSPKDAARPFQTSGDGLEKVMRQLVQVNTSLPVTKCGFET